MNTKQEVLENLVFADQYMKEVFPNLKKLPLIITGGASFLLKGFKNKFTLDIDTISDLDESVAMYLESFSINNSASEVTKLPKDFKQRLQKVKGAYSVLELHVLSNEDLVLSKIGRLSDEDLHDIQVTGIMNHVDIPLLTELANELITNDEAFGHKWRYFVNYFSLSEAI